MIFPRFNNLQEFIRYESVEIIAYTDNSTITIPIITLRAPEALFFSLRLYPANISNIPPTRKIASNSRKGPFNSIDRCINLIEKTFLIF